MAYTQNEKATDLDVLVPVSTSLVVMGDPADAGRAKKSTVAQLATTILAYIQASLGGVVQSVTGLNTNNADPANPIVQISVDGVTITGDGTPGNPLVANGGTGSGQNLFNGKIKSYSLEGLEGAPIQNGYTNVESYITSSGTTVYAEIDTDLLQTYDVIADWASATQVNSYVVSQGFLFLLLQDTGTNAYRVYRYTANDLSLGGTLMTIAVQTLGTQDFVVMTSDGIDFFFNYQAGNSTNDYDISRYTIGGTTLTWASDVALGAVANASNVFVVTTNGDYYGLNTVGTREIKQFDNTGTLQNTYTPYDTKYTNIINWTDTIYIAKSVGDDEAYRITEGSGATSGALVEDDFVGGGDGSTANDVGELGWAIGTNAVTIGVNDSNNNPGVIRMNSNGGGEEVLYLPGTVGDINAPSSTYEAVVMLGTATDGTYYGISNGVPGTIRLVIRSNGTNWVGEYVNGGTTTTGAVATTTAWTRLTIVVNGAGTSAQYFVNGVSLGVVSIATSGGTAMRIQFLQEAVGGKFLFIDQQSFSRPVNRI